MSLRKNGKFSEKLKKKVNVIEKLFLKKEQIICILDSLERDIQDAKSKKNCEEWIEEAIETYNTIANQMHWATIK